MAKKPKKSAKAKAAPFAKAAGEMMAKKPKAKKAKAKKKAKRKSAY